MKKIAFIIPGYSESKRNNPAYSKIERYFRQNGIDPLVVDVSWKYRTMTDYVREFRAVYEKNHKGAEVYFLGFSFGAIISFIAAAELKPKAIILCSLSPFFKEDLSKLRPWWKRALGKKRLEDFNSLSFSLLAKKISSRAFIFAGSREVEDVFRRAEEAKNQIRGSKLLIVPEAKHDISQGAYLQEVKNLIAKLK